jgi:hypothetical protein
VATAAATAAAVEQGQLNLFEWTPKLKGRLNLFWELSPK